MPPLGTGSVALHMQPGIRAIVGTRLGGRESYYTLMYNVETSTRNYEDWLYATGLPIATTKPQGQPIQAFDPLEGTYKRLIHETTAMGFEVTEEAWDDDQYAGNGSAIREAAGGLADSLAEKCELDSHRPFNTEGFTAGVGAPFQVLPAGDNEAFFSTAHAIVTGGQGIPQANRPSTNTDLNITSLRTCLTQFRRYRDDQNKRVPGINQPTALIVPPELEFVMKELLGSSNRPDTANLVENVTKGVVTGYVNPYLDDTDSWFVKASKHYAVFLWRWRPRLDSFDDRRSRVAVHVAYQRYSYGPITWMGYYGSNGA